MLSQEELKEFLAYDEDAGIFIWIKRPKRSRVIVGSEAGCLDKSCGYFSVNFNGVKYSRARLAWFYVHGVWPFVIDHIDRVRSNDSIKNLRDCDYEVNNRNAGVGINNSSGFKGVSWNKRRSTWRAQIARKQIGEYDCLIDAVAERIRAEGDLWGTH